MKQNKNMDTTVRPTVKKISEVMQNACKVIIIIILDLFILKIVFYK